MQGAAITADQVVLPQPALPSADWADRWSLTGAPTDLSALDAAYRALGSPPAWVRVLMRLRNRVVALFGLKPAGLAVAGSERVGGFPVVSLQPDQIVLGFDDGHLDFRIVIDVIRDPPGASRVSVTTLVARHNLFGRLYIAVVTPFHRLIVRNSLARLMHANPAIT